MLRKWRHFFKTHEFENNKKSIAYKLFWLFSVLVSNVVFGFSCLVQFGIRFLFDLLQTYPITACESKVYISYTKSKG